RISPVRPPPPGGSGQGPTSQETSHPANWAEQSADVRGVALTKPIILPSPLVCWHAAWQQPTSCARAVESPTSNPTPSARPGLTSRYILISTSVLWDVGMSDERKKWAIQRARRGRRRAGDALVNQAKRAHDRRRTLIMPDRQHRCATRPSDGTAVPTAPATPGSLPAAAS